jgi:hypothetical protein
MRAGFCGVCALAVCVICCSPAHAQVVEISEGPFKAFARLVGEAPDKAIDPTPYVLAYAAVLPGQSAKLSDVSIRASSIAYAYPALEFVFSMTPKVFVGDPGDTHRAPADALRELKRLNAHVHVEALATDRQTVINSPRTAPTVLTLMTAPSELTYAKPEGRSEIASTAQAAAGFLGPIGTLVQAFTGAHHSPPGPSLVAYQSADDEFGWTWYDSAGASAEGMHRCAALLQVKQEAAYLRIVIEIVTDWERFGTWVKPYTFLIALNPPAPATKK